MPCKPAKAKKLLRNGKAKVISRMPFVIQLLFGSSGYKQKVVQKLDSGSKTVGTAAVRADGKVLYASEIKTRTDIPERWHKDYLIAALVEDEKRISRSTI